MQVSISPDFQNLLPPLSAAELQQHEDNCLADPKHERMPPVLVWENGGNVVIDGHNQHRVRQQHNLSLKYSLLNFANRDEALQYALGVQFGRRNLDTSQRAIAYAKLPRVSEGRPDENVANLQRLSDLAQSAGVSKRTMSDATKVADKGVAEIVAGVQAGDFSASDAAAVVDLPQQEQQQIADEAKRCGTTLRNAKSNGGTKSPPSGTSVVPNKDRELVRTKLGEVIRGLESLGLYKEFKGCLSQILVRLKELK